MAQKGLRMCEAAPVEYVTVSPMKCVASHLMTDNIINVAQGGEVAHLLLNAFGLLVAHFIVSPWPMTIDAQVVWRNSSKSRKRTRLPKSSGVLCIAFVLIRFE